MALSLRSFLFQGLTFTLSSFPLKSLANCFSHSFISSLSKLGRPLQYPDILTSSPSFVCVERQYCCAAVEMYPKIFGGCKYFKTIWRGQIFQKYLEGANISKQFEGCKYFKTIWRVQICQNYLEGANISKLFGGCKYFQFPPVKSLCSCVQLNIPSFFIFLLNIEPGRKKVVNINQYFPQNIIHLQNRKYCHIENHQLIMVKCHLTAVCS